MNRCSFSAVISIPRTFLLQRRTMLVVLAAIVGSETFMLTVKPAAAQVQGSMGGSRNFPDASLRGTLTIGSGSDATLNGRAVRMAPGMRLFSPQNTLVMAHTVLGKSFRVNYLIEPSTGMLLSAWILSQGEADQARKGSDFVDRNYRSEFDKSEK